MALTLEQLAEVRTWLPWDPPDDTALQARHDALGGGSYWALVKEQLRLQYLTLLMTPASFTVPGDWSQNTTTNLDHMRKLMADVDAAIAGEAAAAAGGVIVQQLYRDDPGRPPCGRYGRTVAR